MTKFAFTLAEVLITLGIIGIVAAITIPTLIANQQKQETVAKLKKSFSMLSQVVVSSEQDNGPSKDWDWGTAGNHAEIVQCFNTYWTPYLKVSKYCSTSPLSCGYTSSQANALNGQKGWYLFMNQEASTILADGTFFGLIWDGFSKVIIIDLNAAKPPNIQGKDIFVLQLGLKGLNLAGRGISRTTLLNDTTNGCNKVLGGAFGGALKGSYCGAVIQQDGWQIKDDYPWN